MSKHDHSLETRLQHIAATEQDGGIPVALPIYQTSTVLFQSPTNFVADSNYYEWCFIFIP